MPTTIEYALLAANVYGALDIDSTNPLIRSQLNTLPMPDGWSRIQTFDGLSVVSPSGFMATAYIKGTEIVISYAGTTGENGMDWLTGNIAGAGLPAEQVLEAAQFYLNVLGTLGNPAEYSISFTGHSLGGGLASLMSVFFDKSAVVFDEAPFEKFADSGVLVAGLKEDLISAGYTLPEAFLAYVTSVDPTGIFRPSPTREARDDNVTQHFTVGEILSVLDGATINLIAGTLALARQSTLALLALNIDKINNGIPIDYNPGAQSLFGWDFAIKGTEVPLYEAGNPEDLHSMSLLAGFILSSQFLASVRDHPEVLPRIFAGQYAGPEFDPKNRDTHSLLELLVKGQIDGGGALDALARSVNRISRPGVGNPDLSDVKFSYFQGDVQLELTVAAALVDVVLAGLYNEGVLKSGFTDILTSYDGGLGFDTRALGDELESGISALRGYLKGIIGGVALDMQVVNDARWILQNGDSPLNYQSLADARSDVVIGFTGTDFISTGGGDDILIGNAGADVLRGGQGNDTLVGGSGFDRYSFSSDDFASGKTEDSITDSDGSGDIVIDGVELRLKELTRKTDKTWETTDGKFRITVVTASGKQILVVTDTASKSRIVVNDWVNGGLGITLDFNGQITPAPPPALVPLPSLIDQAGDGQGDTPYTSVNDIFAGTAGDDAIDGGLGDDRIDGGGGNDLLLAGPGENHINGGSGNDFIISSTTVADWAPPPDYQAWYDQTIAGRVDIAAYGNGWYIRTADGTAYDPTRPPDQYYFVEAYSGAGDPWSTLSPSQYANGADVITGGSGNDYIRSGEGDDIVDGGDDNDTILGGTDNDIIDGGTGNDSLYGDNGTAMTYDYVSADANPNGIDIINGGEGNDFVWGQGGNDRLFGGDGDDRLEGGAGDDTLAGDEDNDQKQGHRVYRRVRVGNVLRSYRFSGRRFEPVLWIPKSGERS